VTERDEQANFFRANIRRYRTLRYAGATAQTSQVFQCQAAAGIQWAQAVDSL
jgi:hypothetical protein